MIGPGVHERSSLTRTTRDAFTLLEVLIVIAIITVLVAILVPSLTQSRRQAARLACASNLRSVGQALNLARAERGRYPLREPEAPDPSTFTGMSSVSGPVVKTLVNGFLGRPDALYCPTSLQTDPYADRPYTPTATPGKILRNWEFGHISYAYLAGITNGFADSTGQPTFDPEVEAPGVSKSPRLVLIGDRAVDLPAKGGKVAGSNHRREGGWFCFTTGDVQWWSWNRLTAHPTHMYTWYWPRLWQPQPPN
jgi:prepilin-type N-terminal cleavage/methylation domain-containing protein